MGTRDPSSLVIMVTSEVTAQAFLRGYLAYLRERGWSVTLTASDEGGLEQLGIDERVATIDLPMRRDPHPGSDLRSLGRAIRLLRRFKPEVVVAATPKAGLVGMTAAWLTRVPVRVYQVWGLRLETETGPRRALLGVLERVATRLATQVVANSPSLVEALAEEGVTRRAVVLGAGSAFGIDAVEFDRANPNIPALDSTTERALASGGAVATLGYVGRVHPDKGLDTLLAAAQRCALRGVRLNLLLVGPSEDERVEALFHGGETPGLTVVRVDTVSDPRPYFASMDIFCLPTRREGFPTVVLESSAMSIPTITTTATGARDSVLHDVTGLLVPTDDVQQLSEAIERLATDPTLREILGANARRRVVDQFDRGLVQALQEQNLRAQVRQRTRR